MARRLQSARLPFTKELVMGFKAIVATIVLGTSSIASAYPKQHETRVEARELRGERRLESQREQLRLERVRIERLRIERERQLERRRLEHLRHARVGRR